MNILFLGGAKRVAMARFLIEAGKSINQDVKIYSYEIDDHVPISILAKVYIGKRWSDPDIYEDLLSIIKANDISIIIPFVDGAVAIAAEMAAKYPKLVFAPTSTAEISELMFDKVAATEAFSNNGIDIPKTYTAGDPVKSLIAKPRHGSASKGIISINNLEELNAISDKDKYLIQERIDRREEFTVDCYVSVKSGDIVAVVPRKRLEVSGGEVTHTITVDNQKVIELAHRTLQALNLRGAVTVQIIHDIDDDRYLIMEVNPRLGGGAVCAVHAYANIPLLILLDSLGKEIPVQKYISGTEIVRYQEDVVFYN